MIRFFPALILVLISNTVAFSQASINCNIGPVQAPGNPPGPRQQGKLLNTDDWTNQPSAVKSFSIQLYKWDKRTLTSTAVFAPQAGTLGVAIVTGNTGAFTWSGLDSNQEYFFEITLKDINGAVINTKTSTAYTCP